MNTVWVDQDLSIVCSITDQWLICSNLSYYCLNVTFTNYFKSYLYRGTQRVVVQNNLSNSNSSTSGIPQRSVLGPVLFITNMVDFCEFTEFFNMSR